MKIKVCGMTNLLQLSRLSELGIDFTGFIFFEKSPRFVLNHLKGKEVKNAVLNSKKVGVFVSQDYDFIMRQVEDFELDYVQLHGDESPEVCKKLSASVKLIKVFRVGQQLPANRVFEDFHPYTDFFLFDTLSAQYGGTGNRFNWALLNEAKINKPFFLSGGIGPDDAASIKTLLENHQVANLFGVDINSKFESSPGFKEINMVQKFKFELDK